MDTLDLIRKLYDENADPADLEQGLDEERIAELRRLVEAKSAMDALPPRRPSSASLEAIAEMAKQAPPAKKGGLSLILSPRFIQRFAAAAAIVAAVGIGYLTLQSPILTIDSVEPTQNTASDLAEVDADLPASETEAWIATEAAKAPEAPAETDALAGRRSMSKESRDGEDSREFEESKVEEGLAAVIVPEDETFGDSMRLAQAKRLDAGLPSGKGKAGLGGSTFMVGLDTVGWEDGLEFQTFYWQVQALGERSPDDDWEEAVPLEGSFRILEGAKRNPAWLEANSEQ